MSTPKARTGTLEAVKDDVGRVLYYRGKVRLQDGTRARVEIPEPKCNSEAAAREFVAWAQEDEDAHHTIYLAKVGRAQAAPKVDPSAPPSAASTVASYRLEFFKRRRASGRVEDVNTEEGRLQHLSQLDGVRLCDLTTPIYRAAIVAVREGGKLAPRTVIHVHRTFALMLRTAVAEGIVPVNPCTLLPGDLPAKRDADPKWRRSARFTAAEVLTVISDERIPADRRAFYALLFLGALRFGEAAALRWNAYDGTARPLGRLLVDTSYSTKKRAEKETKTEVPREMPVHPILATLLAAWKADGWPALVGRAPTEADLIVPSRRGANRNANHMLRRFHQDLERVGLRTRRMHDARRTFISLAREGGAGDLLKWATHGPGTEIVDLYTTPSWEKLCAEVMCARLTVARDDGPTPAAEKKTAEGVTPSAVGVVHPVVHLDANYPKQLRGGRDSNPRPPA